MTPEEDAQKDKEDYKCCRVKLARSKSYHSEEYTSMS